MTKKLKPYQEAMLDDLKKLHGYSPYDYPGNCCVNDPYFIISIEKKYGVPIDVIYQETDFHNIKSSFEKSRDMFNEGKEIMMLANDARKLMPEYIIDIWEQDISKQIEKKALNDESSLRIANIIGVDNIKAKSKYFEELKNRLSKAGYKLIEENDDLIIEWA